MEKPGESQLVAEIALPLPTRRLRVYVSPGGRAWIGEYERKGRGCKFCPTREAVSLPADALQAVRVALEQCERIAQGLPPMASRVGGPSVGGRKGKAA